MTQVLDPVCGMTVDMETAAGSSTFEGETYFFCSRACLQQFEANPARYVGRGGPADATAAERNLEREIRLPPEPAEQRERHEPPFTKTGGFVAPKFGSAGSGGAEYELPPEMHDKDDRD
jgi:Cu+-exporting ATPase